MTNQRRPSRNPGFTLIELLISILVFGVVMTVAFSFISAQNQGYRKGSEWLSVLQTLRYSVQAMEQDLRTAGTNLPGGQPELVYADQNVVAFNADYATNVENDIFAVYFDPDAPTGQVTALRNEITIPESSFRYPDTLYSDGDGGASPGELLIYFFSVDTTTSRSDDFALYRQVNDGDPELVTRNLLRHESQPFFTFFRDNDARVDSFSAGDLPLRHSATFHLGPADTGSVARIDSINGVRITMAATNGLQEDLERTYGLTRLIRLPNVGFQMLQVCGSRPILSTGLGATLVTLPGGEPAIDLAWARARDEGQGEDDIVRYVIYRREQGDTDWGDPYLSVPAGQLNYSYQDADLIPGIAYQYGLAAQDCTPRLSDVTGSAVIVVP